MRKLGLAALAIAAGCTKPAPAAHAASYLFVWAGDSALKANDFLGVINADPASPDYGKIVTSVPTSSRGSWPHHTDASMPASGHLLANGFHAGTTWLFDLRDPLKPRIDTSFGDLAGFSHPHTYVRLADGHVLATFQYASGPGAALADWMPGAEMASMTKTDVQHSIGGLVEMDERGAVVRSGSAGDRAIAYRRITPYSVLPITAMDRAVSTTSDMDPADTSATAEWVQFWRLSDLKLLRSVALKPGPRGNENRWTGEPRLLPDGKSVYIHTFKCGLYLVRGVDTDHPTSAFVRNFPGEDCGVPILTGHWWLQTVPATHALVSLDITDPEHPREVGNLKIADDEKPHWIAIDNAGRRVVLNSAGAGGGNRLFVIDFDPATGALALDEKFRDAGSDRPGVRLTGKQWPHGFAGTAIPHGTVFSN